MSWEAVEISLKRVTIADDAAKQMAALQLMMGQQLSGKSGLDAVGYDWKTEQRRIADEASYQQELMAKQQQEVVLWRVRKLQLQAACRSASIFRVWARTP
jgi:hypothetical protein